MKHSMLNKKQILPYYIIPSQKYYSENVQCGLPIRLEEKWFGEDEKNSKG